MELRKILLLSILCLGLFILLLQIITLSTGHWRNLYVGLQGPSGDIFMPIGLWTLNTSHGNGAGAMGIISLLILVLLIIVTFLQFLNSIGRCMVPLEFPCYFEKVGIEFFALVFAIICPIVYSFEESYFPDVNQPYMYTHHRPGYYSNGWSIDLQMALCVFHGLLLLLTILETLHRYRIFFPKREKATEVETADPIGNPGFKTSSPKSKEKHLDNSFPSEDLKVEPGEFSNAGFRSSSPKSPSRSNGQLSMDPEGGMENILNPTFKEESPKRPPRHERDSLAQARKDENLVFPKSEMPQISERSKNDEEVLNLELAKPAATAPTKPVTSIPSKQQPPVPQSSVIYADVKKPSNQESLKIKQENIINRENHSPKEVTSSYIEAHKKRLESKHQNFHINEKRPEDNSTISETGKSPREFKMPNHHGFDNNNSQDETPKGSQKPSGVAITPSPHETDL